MKLFQAVFYLCCCFSSLFANTDEMMVIESGMADYDGKKVTLTGNVVVDHEIGVVSANYVELTPEDAKKKLRLAQLLMEENVKIALKDGGQLCCSQATIDYQALTGNFKGDTQQEFVIYTESCRDKKGVRIPLVVKSREMAIQLLKENQEDPLLSRSLIKDIGAENQVTIHYNHDFIASSDTASYERLALDKNFLGLIHLKAETNGLCQITNKNGDFIYAKQISINTQSRQLDFMLPKGTLFIANEEHKRDQVDFKSDQLIWDENRDLLKLQGQVEITQKGIGHLTTNKEVTVYQYLVNGKKELRCIESEGDISLVYTDEEQDFTHHLEAHGKLLIDHENLKTSVFSEWDENGTIAAEKQVHFYDYLGEIFADRAFLEYSKTGPTLVPVKLILEGKVHLLNRSKNSADYFLQYAIADHVEYDPLTKQMVLSAKKGKRVLFFDKVNNVQVSAPALKVTRDPKMKKDQIQGVGDVRFSFMEQELKQMRRQFGSSVFEGSRNRSKAVIWEESRWEEGKK